MKHKTIIVTREAPAAVGPYSQAVRSGGVLFLSGQIGLDPVTGAIVSGGLQPQTEQVLRNIRSILNSQGLDLSDVVKTTVFITDMNKFGDMNEVYGRHFQHAPPARSTVQVAALPKGALVEIEAIAVGKSGG